MSHLLLERASAPTNAPIVDYGPQLNLTIWFLTSFSTMFLGLRIYCKLWRSRSMWWDDYVLIASWVTLVVASSLLSIGVRFGIGRHNKDVELRNFSSVLFYSYAGGFFFILAAVWSKTSFAITLLRVSTGRVKLLVWFLIVSINLVMAARATIQWVQCWPVEKLWHILAPGTCWSRSIVKNYETFTSVYSGTVDIILALLPWKIIWNVPINRREKIGAMIAMSMGVFAGITSFLKITSLYAIGNSDIITTVSLLMYSIAEGAITIIAASIPILRALFQRPTSDEREDISRDAKV